MGSTSLEEKILRTEFLERPKLDFIAPLVINARHDLSNNANQAERSSLTLACSEM